MDQELAILLIYFGGIIAFSVIAALISGTKTFFDFTEWLAPAFFWPVVVGVLIMFGIFAGIPYVIFMSVKYAIDPTYRVAIDKWFTSNLERVKLRLVK